MNYGAWSINDFIAKFPIQTIHPSPTPTYSLRENGQRFGFAVESMKRHMTDEGWQIFAGLHNAGYILSGHNLPNNCTDIRLCVEAAPTTVAVLQDKREWDVKSGDFRDPKAKFSNVGYLTSRPDVFKLTILKDSQQRPSYHKDSADEMGCHAWIIYYHPRIVKALAPYIRSEHLVRTYHSIDSSIIEDYQSTDRDGCLLSGAVSGAYPLRQKLIESVNKLPKTTYLPHPGYHRNGSATPQFLKLLRKFKVAICTSSMYGYALRKLIEATAAGCMVLTDLPHDEVLPEIDGNLTRIPHNASIKLVASILNKMLASYDPTTQEWFAAKTKQFYDFRVVGQRLSDDIENLRYNYR